MDRGASDDGEARDYATKLEYTLKELQRKVREHEAELIKIRSLNGGAALPSPQAQVAIIQSALNEVTASEPFLPFPGSVLPALLALRKTHQATIESRAYLATQGSEAERMRKQLEADGAGLRDQKLLTAALEARIQALRHELASGAAAAQPQDGARLRVEELRARSRRYDGETKKLMKSLLGFMDKWLASMLAAEELGGPVVGDLVDIEPGDLAGGFNSQGKLRPAKAKEVAGEDRRQRRIDEIWGSGARAATQDGNSKAGGGGGGGGEEDEAAAAGREMRALTEELLNALAEAKGDNTASYVQLARESAAARFLVRSQVALLHPKDATRLRLVDFGRELEG